MKGHLGESEDPIPFRCQCFVLQRVYLLKQGFGYNTRHFTRVNNKTETLQQEVPRDCLID